MSFSPDITHASIAIENILNDLRVWFESQVLVKQKSNHLRIPELGKRITLKNTLRSFYRLMLVVE